MLNEAMKQLVAEFDEKQNALVSAIGGSLKDILANMKKNKAINHGEPPYVIDDGTHALLFVDKNGDYSKLPPDYSLSEDATSQDFLAIYSLPVPSFGLVRFIPMRADIPPPAAYESNFVASAYSPQFLGGLWQYLEVLSQSIPQLAAISMAKRLLQLQPAMASAAKEAEMDLEAFMQMGEVRDAFVGVLGEALVDGAKKASDAAVEARKEKAAQS